MIRPRLISTALLLALAASVGAQTKEGGKSPGGPKAGGKGSRNLPVSVATATIAPGDIEIRISALGAVKALNTVTVRPRVSGQLMKLYVTEGQAVKAGDPLADIDPRPFDVALTQAEGQLARDRAALANAKLDLKRYQDAAEAITRQQLDSAGAQVAQLEGTVKVDEGTVANARLQLEYAKVTAPISGVVGLRTVDVGNVVSSSDTTGLVVITQLQPLSVVGLGTDLLGPSQTLLLNLRHLQASLSPDPPAATVLLVAPTAPAAAQPRPRCRRPGGLPRILPQAHLPRSRSRHRPVRLRNSYLSHSLGAFSSWAR